MTNKLAFDKKLASTTTPIEGLIVYDLTVFGDNRGWFKENWQREKMTAIGLPDFNPVQNNVSYNEKTGVTRGLHTEPWDKFISIGAGKVFGAWCDIREGSPTYGKVFTIELDPTKAIFVPRGIANGFQTLEDNTVYMYLVNDHWSPNGEYSFVSIFDKSLGIKWPIHLEDAIISDKDRQHPNLADATPVKSKKTLVTGANGQLGKALKKVLPNAEYVDREEFDITNPNIISAKHWKDYDTIINAAAYTAVDQAETLEGRREAWLANATAVSYLQQIATENNITLVHVSSDYVFDGEQDEHPEDEPFSPLGVYGQTKAAGDTIAATVPQYYILRTSWVIGEGNNFVNTMKKLAEKDIKPSVVNDQIGRLTFTEDLAKGIKHLITTKAPHGIYNISNSGRSASWAEIAKEIYKLSGSSDKDITPVTTEEYYKGKSEIAPRPSKSTLKLDKIEGTGFYPRDWHEALKEYLNN